MVLGNVDVNVDVKNVNIRFALTSLTFQVSAQVPDDDEAAKFWGVGCPGRQFCREWSSRGGGGETCGGDSRGGGGPVAEGEKRSQCADSR